MLSIRAIAIIGAISAWNMSVCSGDSLERRVCLHRFLCLLYLPSLLLFSLSLTSVHCRAYQVPVKSYIKIDLEF